MFESDYWYEERKKERIKWVIVILASIVFLVVVTKILDSCSRKFAEDIMKEHETVEIQEKLSLIDKNEAEQIFEGIGKKNGDWTSYPLSNEFLKKYNSKDGIFSHYDFDDCDCYILNNINDSVVINEIEVAYDIYKYINRPMSKIGPAWEISIKFLINNNQIDRFLVTEANQIIDENGDLIKEYDKVLTVDNFKNIIWDILFYDGNKKYPYTEGILDDREPIDIAKQPCSSKLINKVLNKDSKINRVYNDFFPQYDCGGGSIYFRNDTTTEEAFEKREFYVACRTYAKNARPFDGDKPEHYYLYRIHIYIDKDNKLDDFSLEFISEKTEEELNNNYHF